MNELRVCALGETPYRAALALQEGLVRARAAGQTDDWLLYPDHPPVLTVGRSPSAGAIRVEPDVLRARGIEVFEVARGGDVTWHGPGQLVGYTIVDLTRRGRDVHRFLRDLEETLIAALAGYGLKGERIAERTGVWVEGRKVASIGVAVRRWVSYHGFALNVAPELSAFDVIHPCGLRDIEMTSLSACLGERAPSVVAARSAVADALCDVLGYTRWSWGEADEVARLAEPAERPESALHTKEA